VAISLLSFVVFIFGMLIWMSCFFMITPHEKNEFKEVVVFFLILLVTALSSHLWGFVINRWIKKMNPDKTFSKAWHRGCLWLRFF